MTSRGRLAAVAFLVLGLVLVAAVLAWSRAAYRAELGYSGGVINYRGPERRAIEPPSGHTQYVFQYRAGAPFSLGFTFSNGGSRSVRVLGFPQGNTGPYFKHLGVWTGPGDDPSERQGGSPREALVPFRPFTLSPGEHRYVELRYGFAHCQLPLAESANPEQFGGGAVLTEQRVRYRVAGLTRNVRFDLPAAVGLEGAIGDCPWPAR